MDPFPKKLFPNTVLYDQPSDDGPDFTWILSVLLFIMILFLSFISFFGVCEIEGDSMNDTLFHQNIVLTYKYPLSIQNGDIVTLKVGEDNTTADGILIRQKGKTLIKRVIATGGETLKFEKGPSLIDGRFSVKLYRKSKGGSDFIELNEPYIKEPMLAFDELNGLYSAVLGKETIVPEDHYFVMGDNRNNSTDSRTVGCFSRDEIIEKLCANIEKDSFFESFLLWLYRNPKKSEGLS